MAAAFAVVATASPASAQLGVPVLIAPTAGVPTTGGPYHVVPTCAATVGVATGLNQVTFAIAGTAEAYATNGAIPVATGVHCVVVDARTGAGYGSTPSTALPGPFGASAGTVNVPLNSDPMLCGYGYALFSDGHFESAATLGC